VRSQAASKALQVPQANWLQQLIVHYTQYWANTSCMMLQLGKGYVGQGWGWEALFDGVESRQGRQVEQHVCCQSNLCCSRGCDGACGVVCRVVGICLHWAYVMNHLSRTPPRQRSNFHGSIAGFDVVLGTGRRVVQLGSS
jgi:hypothetical protein